MEVVLDELREAPDDGHVFSGNDANSVVADGLDVRERVELASMLLL